LVFAVTTYLIKVGMTMLKDVEVLRNDSEMGM
jgi:hypothetical protein